jgi:hypothetical protein
LVNVEGREKFGHLAGVDGRIIFKLITKKYGLMTRTGFMFSM